MSIRCAKPISATLFKALSPPPGGRIARTTVPLSTRSASIWRTRSRISRLTASSFRSPIDPKKLVQLIESNDFGIFWVAFTSRVPRAAGGATGHQSGVSSPRCDRARVERRGEEIGVPPWCGGRLEATGCFAGGDRRQHTGLARRGAKRYRPGAPRGRGRRVRAGYGLAVDGWYSWSWPSSSPLGGPAPDG